MRILLAVVGVIGLCGSVVALTQSTVNRQRGVPIVYLEACRVETTPLSRAADAQGRLATYQLTVGQDGAPAKLVRTGDPANLVRFVRIEQFESCLGRWRFGTAGNYTITVFGGTVGLWRIEITQGERTARIDLKAV